MHRESNLSDSPRWCIGQRNGLGISTRETKNGFQDDSVNQGLKKGEPTAGTIAAHILHIEIYKIHGDDLLKKLLVFYLENFPIVDPAVIVID